MKVSVSLPDEDVTYLDEYAQRTGLASRSGALQRAVALLRAAELGPDYAEAWAEDGELTADWDVAAGDGLQA
jgi:hypothetical protein